MEKIVEGDGFDRLDPAVRRFIDAAWMPPSDRPETAGVRWRMDEFQEKRRIMAEAAFAMDRAFQDERDEELVYDPNPAVDGFATWTFREDPTLRAYRLIVKAWNERRDLGTCQTCGSLLLPGKGRVAKFCDDVCRMRQNRGRMTLQERIERERAADPEAWEQARRKTSVPDPQSLLERMQKDAEQFVKQAPKDRPAAKKPRRRRSSSKEGS